MTDDTKTVLVIGATGQTGKHVVKQALEQRFKVKAIVRDVSKLPDEVRSNANFEAVQGSFTDSAVLEQSVKGVAHIVCMAADAKLSAEGPFMLTFVKELVRVMRASSVKRFLYQAGGFANDGVNPQPWPQYLLRITVGYGFGFRGTLRDNDEVIKYLRTECEDIAWIVTRPAVWSDKASRGKVVRNKAAPSGVEFVDLAAVNLSLVQDESAVHSCDYLSYEK